MELSVVMPCYNAREHIGVQLSALSRQKFGGAWELIIADNGSTDGSMSIAARRQSEFPTLRIVNASGRRGSAHARNAGASAARGDLLVFVDADDEVGAGYLQAMRAALAQHDFVAPRFDIAKLNPKLAGASLRNPQDTGLQRVAYPPYLPHAGGSGLGIRRAIHQRVGGFDESLPRLEDTDYCFRVQTSGVALHFAADALMHVRYNTKPRALFTQARLWAEYNELMYSRYGAGVPMQRPWTTYARTWRALIRCLPRLLAKDSRAGWMRTLGTQVGLLQGAIRFRVPPVH